MCHQAVETNTSPTVTNACFFAPLVAPQPGRSKQRPGHLHHSEMNCPRQRSVQPSMHVPHTAYDICIDVTQFAPVPSLHWASFDGLALFPIKLGCVESSTVRTVTSIDNVDELHLPKGEHRTAPFFQKGSQSVRGVRFSQGRRCGPRGPTQVATLTLDHAGQPIRCPVSVQSTDSQPTPTAPASLPSRRSPGSGRCLAAAPSSVPRSGPLLFPPTATDRTPGSRSARPDASPAA
jgi:hypothetical protein